tara:strand:- start:824 stop:1612 length:789 start_codon:yes stop_codon:yes gene_type:complete
VNFYKPEHLPRLMVAPNGARPMKRDHPEVPVSVSEIVKTGKACFDSGAEAIHFHIRDKNGQHVLDSGLCKEALNELNKLVPKMHLQITTEAVGKYSPEEMRKLAYEVMPPGISIGIREMIPSRKPTIEDVNLYQKLTEAKTKIQHICYEPEDVDLLSSLLDKAKISKNKTWCMFVIGHYTGKVSNPKNIFPFIEKLNKNNINADWAVCAFDKEEISCLKMAIKLGGKIRVGFENSLLMPDGSIAPNNETKVKAASSLFDLNP